MPRRARPQRRRPGESYEEKSERRQEAREGLRRRSNVTPCRPPARPAPRPAHSPRQREFLRRRNLDSEAGETLPGQEPEARTPPDPSSRVEPRPSILLQVTPALQHSSGLSVLQPPLKHQDPSQNTAKTEIAQTKMCTSLQTLQSQAWGCSHLPPCLLLFAKP